MEEPVAHREMPDGEEVPASNPIQSFPPGPLEILVAFQGSEI
jgi:hypothetical protein